MPTFSLKHPYFIIVICLMVLAVGLISGSQMPVDMFPPINMPVVLVATFYNGMPPEQIENDITGQFERMFTLASGIEHIESRSLPGVSLIKVFFQPGSNPDADATGIPGSIEEGAWWLKRVAACPRPLTGQRDAARHTLQFGGARREYLRWGEADRLAQAPRACNT